MRWRPVVGFEDTHEVSDTGMVRSRRKYLKTWLTKQPPHYKMVTLYKDGKLIGRSVHSLVAEAFIGPRPEGQVVCHGELGTENNSARNLSYGSRVKNYSIDRNRDHKYRSQHPGVDLHKGKWRARSKGKHIGYFTSEQEAADAYQSHVGIEL